MAGTINQKGINSLNAYQNTVTMGPRDRSKSYIHSGKQYVGVYPKLDPHGPAAQSDFSEEN